MAQGVTAYADDFHAGSQVQNTAGLDSRRFKGNFARLWMKQRVRTTPDGDLFRLRTPRGHLSEFPVVRLTRTLVLK